MANLLLLSLGGGLHAQLISTKSALPAPVQIMMDLDSMEQSWEVQQAISLQYGHNSPKAAPVVATRLSDEKLASQLRQVQGEMSFVLHERVRYFIELYAGRRKWQTEALLGLENAYAPQIESELRKRHLPRNLRHLPSVLSAYHPRATNGSGGAGIWQLPYHAALRYGLACDALQDERRDPIRSTTAALGYIEDLHAQYRDWTMTVLAFTCGPASLEKAKLRAGAGADFAKLYPHLPESSRDYFPAFVAMSYLSQYYRSYDLSILQVAVDLPVKRIPVERPLSLGVVSRGLNIPLGELKAANPGLRGDMVCVAGESGTICMPLAHVAAFEQERERIFALEDARKPVPATEPEVAKVIAPEKPPVPAGAVKTSYTIQPGDNLGAIAERHKVKISELKAWNGISGTLIKAGDKLVIWQAASAKAPSASKSDNRKPVSGKTTYQSYTVKSGDTLWGISQQFKGVSAEDIMAANGISEAIQPGQVLKIPIAQ